jgi:hypothetical protein
VAVLVLALGVVAMLSALTRQERKASFGRERESVSERP